MVLTNNKKFEKELIKLKTFNRRKDKMDWHDGFGLNFKITDMQSALEFHNFQHFQKELKVKEKSIVYSKKLIQTILK